MSEGITATIGGDLGDAIVSLALLSRLPGKHTVRFVDRPPTMIVDRVPLIKKLFESQPYIEKTEISEEKSDIDLTRFRRWHSSVTSLWNAQGAEYTFQTQKVLKEIGKEPWVTVEPDTAFANRVIIGRSPRYNNFRHPWKKIYAHYGHRLLFVGLPQEHAAFEESWGLVQHLLVRDFHELARYLAGCALCIMNQSSPQMLAMSLGCRIIQETCEEQPDVILPRENVQYVCDGACVLPDVDGSGELKIESHCDIPCSFNKSLVPPGMWCFNGLPPSPHFALQCELVKKMEGCSQAEAENKLFEANARRVPGFFQGLGTGNAPLDRFNTAYANVFKPEKSATTLPGYRV